MKLQFSLLAVCVLAGCVAPPRSEIAAGHATLIPNTVSVETFGYNYKLTGIVDLKGERVGMQTMATDCAKGTGSLRSTTFVGNGWTGGGWIEFENLIAAGNTPPDKLFHDICAAGLPTANAMEASLTPEQRKARQERMQQLFQSAFPHQ